MRISGLCG